MPLIQVHLLKKSPEFINQLSEQIHLALMSAWKIPTDDCFQIFHQKDSHELRINQKMFNVHRSEDVVLLHITTTPRTEAMKLEFYQTLSEQLSTNMNIRKEDIFISIVENTFTDWSFGNGEAQLLQS